MDILRTYFTESLQELHQVRWPTRQQAVRLSIITVGFTLAASVVFGAVDYVLSLAVQALLNLVSLF